MESVDSAAAAAAAAAAFIALAFCIDLRLYGVQVLLYKSHQCLLLPFCLFLFLLRLLQVLRMNRLQRKLERSKKQPKNPRAITPGLHLAGNYTPPRPVRRQFVGSAAAALPLLSFDYSVLFC
jgi:hypothetical protein